MDTPVQALEEARTRGDPLADALVERLFELGGPRAVGGLLQHLVSERGGRHGAVEFLDALTRDADPELRRALDRDLQAFLIASVQPPRTFAVNVRAVKQASEVFMSSGVLGLVALLHASLPSCYLMKRGVQVLGITQQLRAHAYRRLLETAQMVVASMSDGGLRVVGGSGSSSPRLVGPGVLEAQKVRLLHATVRRLLVESSRIPDQGPEETGGLVSPETLSSEMARRTWNSKDLGLPINQEDMAYTLLTFGLVIPDALVRLGVPLTNEEREAVLHLWNLLGVVMGVEEVLIVHGLDDARRLFERIQADQAGASRDGRALTRSLIECVEGVLHSPWVRWLPHVLVRFLMGPRFSSYLGVPRASVGEYGAFALLQQTVYYLAHLEVRVAGRSRLGRRLFIWGGRRIVTGLASLPRHRLDGVSHSPLELSDDLRRAWGLASMGVS